MKWKMPNKKSISEVLPEKIEVKSRRGHKTTIKVVRAAASLTVINSPSRTRISSENISIKKILRNSHRNHNVALEQQTERAFLEKFAGRAAISGADELFGKYFAKPGIFYTRDNNGTPYKIINQDNEYIPEEVNLITGEYAFGEAFEGVIISKKEALLRSKQNL